MSQPEGVALGDTEGKVVIVSILWHWLSNRLADSDFIIRLDRIVIGQPARQSACRADSP